MAQAPQADWVNFQEIKAKVRFEHVLGHFGIWSGIDREGENLIGPCPICKGEGFKINLAKGSFSCPGCKKRGSVIDFTAAYKRVGLKEAGVLLKGIMETQAKPQVKEAPGSERSKRRKRTRAEKENPPAAVANTDREGLAAIARNLQAILKEATGLVEQLLAKLEDKA